MNIHIHNISKTFGVHKALEGVSAEISSGSLVSLLGPSGCGKTTLLRILSGIERPDSGKITANNTDISHISIQNRKCGFVFQQYSLFTHMTAFENVSFGLRMQASKQNWSASYITQRTHEVLDLVQLADHGNKYPRQLSGGQQQRIALARSLAVRPNVLLLDEPFGALDANVRRELRRWLQQLHKKVNITTILVTHDQDEAFEISDTVILMNHGRIEQIGAPRELYHSPANPFVYEFLGPCNILQGKLLRQYLSYLSSQKKESAASSVAPNGKSHIIYARPHHVKVLPVEELQDPSQPKGTITRISFIGNIVEIEIKMDVDNTSIESTVSEEHWSNCSFVVGQEVGIHLQLHTVFPSTSTDISQT